MIAGYYLGPLCEHCPCYNEWATNAKSRYVGQTVIFKHKYIIQPPLTTTYALLRASDSICRALNLIAPSGEGTCRVIDALMDIFKGKVNEERTNKDKQQAHKKYRTSSKGTDRKWIG